MITARRLNGGPLDDPTPAPAKPRRFPAEIGVERGNSTRPSLNRPNDANGALSGVPRSPNAQIGPVHILQIQDHPLGQSNEESTTPTSCIRQACCGMLESKGKSRKTARGGISEEPREG
jgi:hypothetical protein